MGAGSRGAVGRDGRCRAGRGPAAVAPRPHPHRTGHDGGRGRRCQPFRCRGHGAPPPRRLQPERAPGPGAAHVGGPRRPAPGTWAVPGGRFRGPQAPLGGGGGFGRGGVRGRPRHRHRGGGHCGPAALVGDGGQHNTQRHVGPAPLHRHRTLDGAEDHHLNHGPAGVDHYDQLVHHHHHHTVGQLVDHHDHHTLDHHHDQHDHTVGRQLGRLRDQWSGCRNGMNRWGVRHGTGWRARRTAVSPRPAPGATAGSAGAGRRSP